MGPRPGVDVFVLGNMAAAAEKKDMKNYHCHCEEERQRRRSNLLRDCFAALAMTVIFIAVAAHAESSFVADYNRGTELYKQGKYEDAIGSLQKALLSDDPAIIAKAHYNLGSAYYQAAKASLSQNASTAKKDLQHARQEVTPWEVARYL